MSLKTSPNNRLKEANYRGEGMAVDPKDFMRWLDKFAEDMMKPYLLALEKLNAEQMVLKTRIEAMEAREQCTHEKPYGGR